MKYPCKQIESKKVEYSGWTGLNQQVFKGKTKTVEIRLFNNGAEGFDIIDDGEFRD